MQNPTSHFLSVLKTYDTTKLKKDMVAGITVAVMLIPQGMAYAMLAGLPPIYGLYAGLLPLFIYPFLGSSHQLSVGPVALVSILVLSGLGQIAEPGSEKFIELAILTAVISGIIQVVLSVFRLGFLVKFLSDAVLTGFTSAAAIIISFSQIKNILGLELDRSTSILSMAENLLWHIDETNFYSFILGITGLVLLLVIKKLNRSFPTALVLLVLGTLAVAFFELDQKGVAILGAVPPGLPNFVMPDFSLASIQSIFSLSIIICLLSFIESLAIAKTIAARHNHYPINANQELLALGISKIAGGFFQAYPTTGSFTRSAINDSAGAQTGVASIFAAILVGITLMFFSSSVYYLPKAILGAIIFSAVLGLINVPKIKFYYQTSKHDFWVMVFTFVTTLLFGIQNGMIVGILLSISYILHRTSKPFYAILGNLEGTNVFRNVERFPEAKEREDLLIIRFDAAIYFGNASYLREIIWTEIRIRAIKPTYLVLDFSSIPSIDATGLQTFAQIVEELDLAEINLILTNVLGPTRDRLTSSGLMDKIGAQNQFLINKDAYTFTLNPHARSAIKMKYATQTEQKNDGGHF